MTTKSVCPLDCPDTCSMLVTVIDGIATYLKGDPEHPFTRGFLCQKVHNYLERVYHPDRLLYPLKRIGRKGEGKFERISWEEAIRTIETRFRYNRDFESIYAMVPGTIALLLVQIPAILMAVSVVREKELGSIINFFVTPTTRLEFLIQKQ